MQHLFTLVSIAIIFGLILVVVFVLSWPRRRKAALPPKFEVNRLQHNPIIRPTYEWNAQGAFNPTAAVDDEGRVHMLYRAVSSDGVSRLGYAASADGKTFDDRLPYPVFAMTCPRIDDLEKRRYDMLMYPSGGSWGGCEDPRMVIIEDTAYVTFSAFDSWNSIRIGLATIPKKDLFEKKFKWSEPQLISPAGQVNKNWVLFPEKINGKFAIIHSVSPEILIDYVDNLRELSEGTTVIESKPPAGTGRPSAWDSRVRGAGPPPLRTPKGWLLFYHAIDKKEPDRYKLGAMLLDLADPTKVLYRANAPIIAPDMWYENDWKPGIVYACGAIVRNGELFIYYGGGDQYVCAAHTPLTPFLDWLVKYGKHPKPSIKR